MDWSAYEIGQKIIYIFQKEDAVWLSCLFVSAKKKITFIVGLFLFAITAVLFGGKLIGTVQQTAAHSKIKSEKILGGTEEERQKPQVIGASRKVRIAKGSGTRVQDVNELLKQFEQMKKMMKQFSNPKQAKLLKRMKRLGGKF